MMKLRAVQQTGGEDIVAGYEPEGDMVEAKYEAGASTLWSKNMSIRNKRAVGIEVVMLHLQRRKGKHTL